ncbi:hypothetical protein DDE82_001328 [Stemphylium lycopersici]|nr:hypothetical protein TW65_06807 [Stemphylium lycopersici]RAR10054.1 hypothetical protein DDE82_001328 [Stemphylium lycopersici]
MDAPLSVSSPQKRRASVSNVKGPVKRARAVSMTLRVSHLEDSPNDIDDPKVSSVPRNREACLGGIPEELLLNIMQHLEDDEDALAKLCRTDDRCKRIAQEVLYKRISYIPFHYDKAKAIARNRSLADSVRFVYWTFSRASSHASLLSEDIRIAMRVILAILRNARNLQSITIIQLPDSRFEKYEATHIPEWLRLFNSVVNQPVAEYHNQFTHLRALSIIAMADPFQIEEMSSVFRLPSLETLRFVQVHQTTPFRNWPIPNSTCHIKNLEFRGTMIDISAFTQMISSLKALRSLTYHRSTRDWEPFGAARNPLSNWPEHSWERLGDAMRQHQSSLEEFSAFDDSDNTVMDIVYPNGRNFGLLGSFKDFQKLSTAAAPLEALLDMAGGDHDLSSCLPTNLNEFSTKLTSIDSENLAYLAPALASLEGPVCVDPDPFVQLEMTSDQLDKTPNLSGALTTLEKAGIKVNLWVGYSLFSPEDLRRMESEGKERDIGIEEGDIGQPEA